jgi:hypothetical protein
VSIILSRLLAFFAPLGWWAALALAGLVGVQTLRVDHALRDMAEMKAAWSTDRQHAADLARKAEADARAEEQRRAAAQKEITDEYERRIQASRADAAVADAAAGRLQQRVAALVAAARQAASHPGVVVPSAPADDPTGMFADVLGRCVARVRVLAAVADERGAAGTACEREYDALTPSTTTPEVPPWNGSSP